MLQGLIDWFFEILYRCFALICQLVDFLKDIFYMMCGITPVTINGKPSDLLTSIISSEVIKRVFLMIFIIGVILMVIFTMIALVKANYQSKRNWKEILSKSGGSFLIALLIPFTVFAGILLTNVVMASINTAMNSVIPTGRAMIGGQFLVTIGTNAYIGNIPKIEADSNFVSGAWDYTNFDLVKQYYSINDMNYVVGILGSFVMLVMFVLSSITFVQRIFDTVLLYIISPVSISTIPLDEGNRFKVWKDMMIAKILSAYGVILSMNIFFLIMPIISNITFFQDGFQNGIVQIVFLIGGAFAVTKASRVISQLCGAQQAGGELASMIYNTRSALAFTRTANRMIGGGMGRLFGGSDFARTKRKYGLNDATGKALHSKRNQRAVDPKKEQEKRENTSKGKSALQKTMRFASMPVGMVHDLAMGGVVQMGKNFGKRWKNVKQGTSWMNHADVEKTPKKKKDKEDDDDEEKEEKKMKKDDEDNEKENQDDEDDS